jgi:hypothetical protein
MYPTRLKYQLMVKHHGVGFEGRNKNRQWSHRKVEREHRKKESEEQERERGGEVFRELSHAE